MNTISETEALQKMKLLQHEEGAFFKMKHLTFNSHLDSTRGLRVVNKAKIRASLPSEKFAHHRDMYLPYYDLGIDENRMCFKRLIREVAFPPEYIWIKIKRV